MVEKYERSEFPMKYVMVMRCFRDWEDTVMPLSQKPNFDQFKENKVAILPCIKHVDWRTDHACASVVIRILDTGKEYPMRDEAKIQAERLFKKRGIEKSKYKVKPKPKKRRPFGSF